MFLSPATVFQLSFTGVALFNRVILLSTIREEYPNSRYYLIEKQISSI